MRGYLVAGNWKMNGSNAANAELVDGIIAGMPKSETVELLVCPPFPYLAAMAAKLSGTGIALGAQNVSQHESGAYTGETAPSMLSDVGCQYVIVGHSERRAIMGESSETIAAKFQAAQDAGLKPVLCVGETQGEREGKQTEAVVDEQLNAVLDAAGIEALQNAVIAYEPVWAIGTGLTATPEQAHVRILYGGSVKGDNAAGLFGKPDIDGGLIGGASLKPADFLAIAEAAASLN
jgi:triosephosphate isomerase